MTGRLYGVGLGPGDPELITLKAARLISAADVVAYHSGTHGRSIARSIAADLLPPSVIEEALVYPVTTGPSTHNGGYQGAMTDFYDESAERLAAHLRAGRTVVVLCEGDPLFYGSYMYLHDRLAPLLPHRSSARRDVGVGCGRGGWAAVGASRGCPDHPARDTAGTGIGEAAGGHPGCGDHEAGPHFSRRPCGPGRGRSAR